MSTPLVSVIVPVYNTELYVREALCSILNQTFRDVELLVINDGSTDGSLLVINELAETDARIRVFSQQNQGQSAARNFGISRAKGDYLYFMDSDDRLEPEALSCCYERCQKEELDFICFDASIFTESDAPVLSINYDRREYLDGKSIYSGLSLLHLLLTVGAYSPSACLLFIRKSYLLKSGILFYPGIIHEDELFTTLLHLQATCIGYVPKAFFNRRFRSDSTMTRSFAYRNMEGYFTVASELLRSVSSRGAEVHEIGELYLKKTLNAAVRNAYVLPFRDRMKVFVVCLNKHAKRIQLKTWCILLLKKHLTHTRCL